MHESIQNLLSDSTVDTFEIPVFQREYNWTTENAIQLFKDVEETQQEDRNSLLGLLVLIAPQENTRCRQVVDGQQRLTTISILLAILRSRISDLETSQLNQREQSKKFEEIGTIFKCLFREGPHGELVPLLQFHDSVRMHRSFLAGIISTELDLDPLRVKGLTHTEQSELLKSIQREEDTCRGQLEWMKNRDLFNQTTARGQNARKNFEELFTEVDKNLEQKSESEKLRWLSAFSQTIRDQLSIIKYKTDSFEDAFVLFETLNDRGMAVAASDLIKNFCLQSDPNNIRQIGQTWSEIFGELVPANHVSPMYFLRVVNNSTTEFVTNKGLFRSYRALISTQSITSGTWLRTVLHREAKLYEMMTISLNNLPQHTPLSNIYFALDSTDSKQWHSIGLSCLRLIQEFQQSTAIKSACVDILLSVFHATVILEAKGLRGSTVERPFPKFAVNIHEFIPLHTESAIVTELKILLNDLRTFRDENQLTIQGLADIIKSKDFSNKTAKSVLTAIRLHDLPHGMRLSKLTIEHVMPQKPNFQRDWPNWNEEQHQRCVQKLGNLLCIDSSANASASNNDFASKKELYRTINAPDMIESGSHLHYLNIESWNEEDVNKRTIEISERLSVILR